MSSDNTTRWVAELMSELINAGLDEDEHLHWHQRYLSDLPPPNAVELQEVDLQRVMEELLPHVRHHLNKIIEDYKKVEEK